MLQYAVKIILQATKTYNNVDTARAMNGTLMLSL